jgi:hypothetical protein
MAPLNFEDRGTGEREYQCWVIEDSWEGCIFLEARVIKAWQGLCGNNKLLEGRDGHFYWWAVLFTPGQPLQRVITFLDWDSVVEEFGITESEEQGNIGMEVNFH